MLIQYTRWKETKTKMPQNVSFWGIFSDPAGIRTQDPYIKSVMLYQLSYEIEMLIIFTRFLTRAQR